MRYRISVLVLLCSFLPATAWSQTELVTTPPPNLVLSNYNSTSVGPYGGLEGLAHVARIGDPSSVWFNPAGLARRDAPQISGSAGVYQRTTVSPRALASEGGAIQQLPSFVGFTFVPHENVTMGAGVLSTNAWSQETDAELIQSAGNAQQRFAYTADSGFEVRVGAFAVGYQFRDAWRFGGGLALSIMDLRLVQGVSDRIADPSGLRSLLVSARAAGSAWHLRSQFGVQYDRGNWRLGGAARTPGVTVRRTGSAILDGVLASEPGSLGASLFDADAHLEYRLPWEFQTGAAFVRPRVELEFDVQAYTPIEAYQLLSSAQPVLVYTGAGPDVPPNVTSHPFAGLTSASNGVVNVSAGGHVRPLKNRDLRIHAGIGSNRSPVAPADVIFNKVNLTTWSVGASGTFGKFQFALGLNRQNGSADDIALRNLLNGQLVHSPIDVHIAGFIYSLAYEF